MLDLTRLPESELSAFVARQPWFRAHGREGAAARVLEATFVHTVAPLLAIALVEVATERGLNEIYQLPVGLRPESERRPTWPPRSRRSTAGPPTTRSPTPSSPTSSSTSSAPPASARTRRLRPSSSSPSSRARRAARRSAPPSCGAIGEGHSNTSVVVGEELVLKVYRRLARRRQSGARAAALPDASTASRTRPELLGSYEHCGPPDRRDARRPDPLRARPTATAGRSRCRRWPAIPLASSSSSSGSAR